MKLDDIKEESMRGNTIVEPEDDEEEIEGESPDLIYFCFRQKEGRMCERNGQCIRFLLNEGIFDACDDLIIDSPDEHDDIIIMNGENN